ncbi:MAG: hypothetical protein JNK82_21925 [Myxococcaceae bacterium]|nr:hypothetical protein [Myxococcaceae bacterium]
MKPHRSRARGQAITELSLGLLVLVPTLLIGIYLAETSILRLEAPEAATEPLWDATAYSQQQYVGGFVLSPGARATAQGEAQARMTGRTMVYTRASAPVVRCGGAGDMGYAVGGVMGAYAENGGISCTAELHTGDRDLTRGFLDESDGFFREPLNAIRRQFVFRENQRGNGFKMAIGDWGLVAQAQEANECRLTMDSCENPGFFGKAQTVFNQNINIFGRRGTNHRHFMSELMNRTTPPQDFDRVTDFQMSFQGEGDFMEDVPVVEGDREWRTTPFLKSRADAYAARSAVWLGGVP